MYRAIVRVLLVAVFALSIAIPGISLAKSAKRLVVINGIEYTDEDFKNWWKHWNDKNELKVPASLDDFIAFKIMVQQALEMGYDTQPTYLHKLGVFLQVRAMMALKYEEIDSKAVVTEADLRKYFDENYGTKWTLQILTFDSEAKAQRVYDAMKPFNGQVAGRLMFSDWNGANVEEKSASYDEVKVAADDFYKNNRGSWLPLIRSLAVNEVSKPFSVEDNKKYVLFRLVESESVGEAIFQERKQRITEILLKENRNKLTVKLIEVLKKKYNVTVDRELMDSIQLDVDYPKEFLDRKVVSMNDFQATVGDLIYNVRKEKKLRKDLADSVLKDMVYNTLISQTLVNKESLARGYEKIPPLLWTYNFYKENRLRAEVENGLSGSIIISDQDIQNYYNLKMATFTVPEKVAFVLLRGNEDVLKKIWIGIVQGSDFNELAQKYSLESPIQSKDVVDLSPVVVEHLKKLDKGEVGLPFMLEGNYALIKLLDRTPGQVHPLAQVKDKVIDQLKKEKLEIVKAEYISKLKSKSKIDINGKVWTDIVRDLGNGKKD